MAYKRNCVLLLGILTAVLCFSAIPAMALETDALMRTNPLSMENTAGAEPGEELDEGTAAVASPQASQADTVSTWDELASWMKTHQNSGGTVRLGASIVCEAKNVSVFFRAPTTIDLAEHSLTVTGSLELYSPYLTVTAKGGVDASLRVLEGGYLALTADTVEPGAEGAVLWQEEGGILLADLLPGDAAVHYAVQPVAYPRNAIIAPVHPDETAGVCLPSNVSAETVFQGKITREERLVIWDAPNETEAKAIEERRRAKVPGRFDGAVTYGALDCTLIFLDQPVTFTYAGVTDLKDLVQVWAGFTHASLPISVDVECSFDEENWFVADASIRESASSPNFFVMFSGSTDDEEEYMVWDRVQNPILYVRLRWLDAQNADDAYSDVLTVDGNTFEIGSDCGGNRGGGTGIMPPELPPINGGGDVGGSGDSDDLLDPPVVPDEGDTTKPDSSSTSQGASPKPEPTQPPVTSTPEPTAKPPASSGVTPADPSESTSQSATPAPPQEGLATQTPTGTPKPAGSVSGAQGGAANGQKAQANSKPNSQHADASRGAEKSNSESNAVSTQTPVVTPNPETQTIADAGENPPVADVVSHEANPALRVVVGILITGGIIALAMTWNIWSKKLLRTLRTLRKRNSRK